MASFLSTLFGGGAEREAAERNRALYQNYQNQGTEFLNTGLNNSVGNLNKAIGAYDPLSALATKFGAGTDLYLDALGVNGADGNARATASFQQGPGYQFTLNQGLEALNRRRATGGMLDSGNADIDAMTFGTGLADKTYSGWLDRLNGVNQNTIATTGAAAQGRASGFTSLADLYNQDAQNRIGLTGNTTSGMASANNTEAAGRAAGARNLLSAGLGIASLATGGMGGMGGLGSSLSNMQGMFGMSQTGPTWANGMSGSYGGVPFRIN